MKRPKNLRLIALLSILIGGACVTIVVWRTGYVRDLTAKSIVVADTTAWNVGQFGFSPSWLSYYWLDYHSVLYFRGDPSQAGFAAFTYSTQSLGSQEALALTAALGQSSILDLDVVPAMNSIVWSDFASKHICEQEISGKWSSRCSFHDDGFVLCAGPGRWMNVYSDSDDNYFCELHRSRRDTPVKRYTIDGASMLSDVKRTADVEEL